VRSAQKSDNRTFSSLNLTLEPSSPSMVLSSANYKTREAFLTRADSTCEEKWSAAKDPNPEI
jgi:hypothetical protein